MVASVQRGCDRAGEGKRGVQMGLKRGRGGGGGGCRRVVNTERGHLKQSRLNPLGDFVTKSPACTHPTSGAWRSDHDS